MNHAEIENQPDSALSNGSNQPQSGRSLPKSQASAKSPLQPTSASRINAFSGEIEAMRDSEGDVEMAIDLGVDGGKNKKQMKQKKQGHQHKVQGMVILEKESYSAKEYYSETDSSEESVAMGYSVAPKEEGHEKAEDTGEAAAVAATTEEEESLEKFLTEQLKTAQSIYFEGSPEEELLSAEETKLAHEPNPSNIKIASPTSVPTMEQYKQLYEKTLEKSIGY